MQTNYSSLAQLLLEISERHPHQIALKDRCASLTYRELRDKATGLAAAFMQMGLTPGDRIACISKKNVDSLVCFWGILLAGAIPVMLDQDDGAATNSIKIKEVSAKAILLYKDCPLPDTTPHLALLLYFEDLLRRPNGSLAEIELPLTRPEDVCYILLTSGTTGKPKAVQISNSNVLHYTFSIYKKLDQPKNVNAIHASTFAADLGLTNSLVALVSGGMLRILDKEEATDPSLFKSIIEKEKISLLKITPSHLLALMAHMDSDKVQPIQNIVLGGEKLSWETVSHIFSLGICRHLYNHYGPTETTIGAVAFHIEKGSVHFGRTGSVPLGSPLGEGHCFLYSSEQNVGELCISGPGVSMGYYENDAENQKKFFFREIDGISTLCYHTGDICRMLDDGNYEFLYRTDRQVKVKGYRIELGEIELALASHPDVESVFVSLSDTQAHQTIEAYIRLFKERQTSAEQLRSWLSERLPAYKIPSAFHFYTRAPYNSNGKIDMNALKKMFQAAPAQQSPAQSVFPAEEIAWEKAAEGAWKKVLGKADFLPTDDFFQIGGDSLMAIQLIGLLQRHGYGINIVDLNTHSRFSEFISLSPTRSTAKDNQPFVSRSANKFTHSQRNFLQSVEFDKDSYCQTILLETKSKIRLREMALALNYVMQSHAELTASFQNSGIGFIKGKGQAGGWDLGTSILDVNTSAVVQIQRIVGALLKRISISTGKLLAGHIFIDPAGNDYLFLVCHHLTVDVISWNIILDELMDYYEQVIDDKAPPVVPENAMIAFYHDIPTADAHAIRDSAALVLQERKNFRLPAMTVPDAINVPVVHQVVVPRQVSDALLQQDDQTRSPAMVGFLLSAIGNAVLEQFHIPAISVDLEFHGRPQQAGLHDLSRSVGWWSTTFPVNILHGYSSPHECIAAVASVSELANRINLSDDPMDTVHGQRPDIRLNYLGRFPASFGGSSLRMTPSSFNSGSTRSEKAQQEYQLYFTARFIGDDLIIDVQYQSDRFSASMVDKIIRTFSDSLTRALIKDHESAALSAFSVAKSNLPSVGQPLYRCAVRHIDTRRKRVLLTGATGFLGIHLLEALSRNDGTEIYCLVRGEDQADAQRRLESRYRHFFPDWPKERFRHIHVLDGDMQQPRLGLSDTAYDDIAATCDIILHAAADINLLKSFRELEQTNTRSIMSLVQLSKAAGNAALHFVSTLAVSGYPQDGKVKDFSEDDFAYDQRFISDYERSKYEAEGMVRKFFRDGGSGMIYRVGHIAADSIFGRFQHNLEQNRIFQIIKGLLLVKMIPDAYMENLSFSYVDIMAAAVARFSLGGVVDGMNCLHVDNPHYLSFHKLTAMLNELGYDVQKVPVERYRQGIRSFEGAIEDRRAVDLMDNWIMRGINFPRRVNYIHKRSIDVLGREGLYFPALNIEWLAAMIREGVKARYFHQPSAITPLVSGVEEY